MTVLRDRNIRLFISRKKLFISLSILAAAFLWVYFELREDTPPAVWRVAAVVMLGFFLYSLSFLLNELFSVEPYVEISKSGLMIKGQDFLEWENLKSAEFYQKDNKKVFFLVLHSKKETPKTLKRLEGRATVLKSPFYVDLNLLSRDDRDTLVVSVYHRVGRSLFRKHLEAAEPEIFL